MMTTANIAIKSIVTVMAVINFTTIRERHPPNKEHLHLYESRKVRNAPGAIQKKKTLRASPTKQASTQSLGTRAKKAILNAAHLRLYEAGLKKQRQKNGL